jgi:curli biogenesis system outer membrane secretion channel CsgG
MMKKFLLSLILLSAASSAILAQSDRKTAVAVMNLKGSGISDQDTKFLTDRLTIELQRTGVYDVLERDKMAEILKEQGFQQTGACDETACLVEAGRLLPVQKMIGGSFGKIGEVYAAQLRLIDLKTGKVEMTSARDYKGQMEFLLTVGMREVAEELSGTRAVQIQTPVQAQNTPQTEAMMKNLIQAQVDMQSKSGAAAVTWSLLIPGAGHFYAHNRGWGSFFAIARLITFANWSSKVQTPGPQKRTWGTVFMASWISDFVTAPRSVAKYNKALRKKYGLTYEYLPQSKEIKTALSVQF